MSGRLILKPQEHRRIAAGHLWIFSNEVARVEGVTEAGETVRVFSSRRELLGSAYYNPRTLIAARLYSRRGEALDGDFVGRRLQEALAVRRLVCRGREAFRWVNSEGDGLPGLIADVYGDVVVVQILTAGMERIRPLIVEQIERLLRPRAIYERSDTSYRTLEGLPPAEGPVRGDPPAPVEITLDGVRLCVDVVRGQKTGLFLDQVENRRRLQALLPPNARVLDCFCYAGGWGLTALAAGARETAGIDTSAWALEQAEANARLNGWADRCRWIRGDVAEVLQAWASAADGETPVAQNKFDVVVLDPPAFAKSKKHVLAAERAYTAVAALAMRLLIPGGLLAACSCSQHIDAVQFDQIIARAAREAHCRCRILARLGHSPDHPAVPAMPETTYLKGLIVEVRKSKKDA